jgi:hypothetical protein
VDLGEDAVVGGKLGGEDSWRAGKTGSSGSLGAGLLE